MSFDISGTGPMVTYRVSTATFPTPGVLAYVRQPVVAVLARPPAPDALLTAQRHVPLGGSLIPNERQGMSFQRSGVYWVRIPPGRTYGIAAQLCDDAVLLSTPPIAAAAVVAAHSPR